MIHRRYGNGGDYDAHGERDERPAVYLATLPALGEVDRDPAALTISRGQHER